MNKFEGKGSSPFYPDQPVPFELFSGRRNEIEHILRRGVGQVELGKPVTVFLEGDYGIGKTSLAKFTQYVAEREHGLLGIYATLAGVKTLDDVGVSILQATISAGAFDIRLQETIRNALSAYISEINVFGLLKLNTAALKKDAPNVTGGLLPFLKATLSHVKDKGIKGLFLVLDEINGVASNEDFAHFLKATVDRNAARSTDEPAIPLLIMVCGVAERRKQLIKCHEPVARIFDVVNISRLSNEDVREFFVKSFDQARMTVKDKALDMLTDYSAGLPKVMHLLGEEAYWQDSDRIIDEIDAAEAVILAAEEFGKKYVDQQLFASLRSKDYLSILNKIAKKDLEISFTRGEILQQLTETEKGKLDNLLQRMKTLKVIKSGPIQGEFIFYSTMARVYLWLLASRDELQKKRAK